LRSVRIRSLRYLNGRTLSPFPAEAGHSEVRGYGISLRAENRCANRWGKGATVALVSACGRVDGRHTNPVVLGSDRGANHETGGKDVGRMAL